MRYRLALCSLGLGLWTALLAAQTTGPSAWIYVSNMIGTTSTAEVTAFTAASSGKLTPISGSPFPADVRSLAVNGAYLFGSGLSGTYIDAYHIASSGALHFAAATNTARNGCTSTPGPVFLDHSGASLYNFDYSGGSYCSNNTYQAYSIVKSTGQLTFLNNAGNNEELTGALSFTGNNLFGYTSDCYHFTGAISGFQRNSNGSLTQLAINGPWPKAPSGVGYCPYLAAADPYNHLAIPVQPYSGYGSPAGGYQLATYTVNSNGTLATSSTSSNMPKVSVGSVTAVSMSPSGKLLAVAGTAGLQVFHFNGAYPITAYTGLMSVSEMDQLAWDNSNHLYAISTSANKLAVFTVTPTSWYWVATYSVNKPIGLAVQPLPLPWQ